MGVTDYIIDKATSAVGDGIKKRYDEHELRKKVDSLVNEYCQGIQETLGLDEEFDVEGLLNGSNELITLAQECTVGSEREVKVQQYFARGYSLAGVDLQNRNRSLDAILASVLNVVLEESGQAVTINAVDEIHKHLDKLATHEDVGKLATHEDIETVIDKLDALSTNEPVEQNCKDFTPYYEYVKKRFTRKKDVEYAKLVGAYSDKEAYIDAFIGTPNGAMPVFSFLKEWFDQDSYGTMLIYGEPGHGKSMLCNKAVFEYCRGKFLPEAKNVLSVTLNTGINDKIIKDGTVNLDAILSWDDQPFTFEDCRGALLFLDGFDEFVDAAQKTNITDIFSFIKKIDYKADVYDIHIVVLSRTIAISDALVHRSPIRNKCYELMQITKRQQDKWLDEHSEYNDYKETLGALRNNMDMSGLLGIPFLFRMIVHTRYNGASKNTVELYDNLIDHLLEKRDIRGNDLKQVIAELCDLAYDIYCNNTDTVIIDGDKRNSSWMIVFYIKQAKHGIYGFFHRSFYQYFLAKYVFLHVLNINTDEQAEEFIGAFAERELDETVREYLSLMLNENNRETIHKNLKLTIEALVWTQAYLNLEPRNQDGTAEKTKLGRTINVYRNTLHLCSAFSYVIKKPFIDGIDDIIRTYPSYEIKICSDIKNRANLCGAILTRAHLRGADLRYADLRGADLDHTDLRYANMRGAQLYRAYLHRADLRAAALFSVDLSAADLSKANLRNAELISVEFVSADLREADLCYVDLSGSNLREAKLIRANLREANLNGVNLSRAELGLADLHYAKLINANLSGTILRGANLSGASLSGSNLKRANLIEANLSGARLRGAELIRANLRRANLRGADLRVKRIDYAIIDSDKKGLFDPSIEGYETVIWV